MHQQHTDQRNNDRQGGEDHGMGGMALMMAACVAVLLAIFLLPGLGFGTGIVVVAVIAMLAMHFIGMGGHKGH